MRGGRNSMIAKFFFLETSIYLVPLAVNYQKLSGNKFINNVNIGLNDSKVSS